MQLGHRTGRLLVIDTSVALDEPDGTSGTDQDTTPLPVTTAPRPATDAPRLEGTGAV
jgi:hypothetical protein